MIDRAGLAEFLRQRREALQPEDVGLPRGARRRTSGLRREEVSVLCHISTDYYSRLERERGPHPSEQMIASIAQGLHLTLDERDHLFRLAGHNPPPRGISSDHVSPGMLRILDRLGDTAAEVVNELGETLLQTPLGTALTGDTTRFTGLRRSVGYRWFTEPESRSIHPPDQHEALSRFYTAALREVATRRGPQSRAADIARRLAASSEEFSALWSDQQIGLRFDDVKRFSHPSVGTLDLNCQVLRDPLQSHSLVVYTADPGTESAEKLQLLAVIGVQPLTV